MRITASLISTPSTEHFFAQLHSGKSTDRRYVVEHMPLRTAKQRTSLFCHQASRDVIHSNDHPCGQGQGEGRLVRQRHLDPLLLGVLRPLRLVHPVTHDLLVGRTRLGEHLRVVRRVHVAPAPSSREGFRSP